MVCLKQFTPTWSVDLLPQLQSSSLHILQQCCGKLHAQAVASGWGRAGEGKHCSQDAQNVLHWWVLKLFLQEVCLLQPSFSRVVIAQR